MNDEVQPEALRRKLAKPVRAHGETISELVFREPTAEDMVRVGIPCVIKLGTDEVEIKHDPKIWLAMLSNLASVPPSTIQQMDPRDFAACLWLLQGFFLPVFTE